MSKSYHSDFYALRGISFEVEQGECVGIIGLNGSGKSTLLKILTEVITQTEGEIEVKGKVSACDSASLTLLPLPLYNG